MTDPPDPDVSRARVGLFGGTFDPPHVGHLIVAQDVLDALELDAVRFEVAARSPFKAGAESAAGNVRSAMVAAAIEGDPRFQVGLSELERGGTSYTVDTLRALRAAEPGVEWFLILGSDQLERFREWREPEEVARLAALVVVDRAGQRAAADRRDLAGLGWRPVEITRVDVSSSEIRERVRTGKSIRYLVPEPVRRIIEDQSLYRGAPAGDPPR